MVAQARIYLDTNTKSLRLRSIPMTPLTLSLPLPTAQKRLHELGVTTIPTLVDTAEESFSKTYAAWPIRWFWLHGRTITSIAQPRPGGVGGYDISALYTSVAEVLDAEGQA